MYIYICMYICVHMYLHTQIYIYTYIYIYMGVSQILTYSDHESQIHKYSKVQACVLNITDTAKHTVKYQRVKTIELFFDSTGFTSF